MTTQQDILTRARQQRIEQNMAALGKHVRSQSWYKEKTTDHHYTEYHARQRCTCTQLKDWLFTVVEVK